MTPSEIVRVLDSLTRRGLVDWSGDRTWIYLGDIPVEREAEWIESGHKPVPGEDIVRFWASPRCIGRSRVTALAWRAAVAHPPSVLAHAA